MRFLIFYANHGNGQNIEDIACYLRNGIRAAGHESYLSPYTYPPDTNVLVEYFDAEFAAKIVASRNTNKTRFIVVATELTNGKTFNPQSAGADMHYGKADYWQARFDNFMTVASVADAVWCLADYQADQYRALLPNTPILTVPRLFDPMIVPPRHPGPEGKDIDLLFTGSLTKYRREILARLEQSFVTVACPPNTTYEARIDLICRAKVNLHINLVEDALINSMSRIHFLAMHKGPVLSERARCTGELDALVVPVETGVPTDEVGRYLASGDWKTRGEIAYKRYSMDPPLGDAMAELIDASTAAMRA